MLFIFVLRGRLTPQRESFCIVCHILSLVGEIASSLVRCFRMSKSIEME